MPEATVRSTRSHFLQLMGPGTGTVAVITSWLIAVPRIRSLSEELGVTMPVLTQVLVDHAGMITTTAIVVATLGIALIELVPRRGIRIGISIVTSLILFGITIWDITVFWLVYVATLQGVG